MLDCRRRDDDDIDGRLVTIGGDIGSELACKCTRTLLIGIGQHDIDIQRSEVSRVTGADGSAAENECPHHAVIIPVTSRGDRANH